MYLTFIFYFFLIKKEREIVIREITVIYSCSKIKIILYIEKKSIITDGLDAGKGVKGKKYASRGNRTLSSTLEGSHVTTTPVTLLLGLLWKQTGYKV